jgi:hypothetical protein
MRYATEFPRPWGNPRPKPNLRPACPPRGVLAAFSGLGREACALGLARSRPVPREAGSGRVASAPSREAGTGQVIGLGAGRKARPRCARLPPASSAGRSRGWAARLRPWPRGLNACFRRPGRAGLVGWAGLGAGRKARPRCARLPPAFSAGRSRGWAARLRSWPRGLNACFRRPGRAGRVGRVSGARGGTQAEGRAARDCPPRSQWGVLGVGPRGCALGAGRVSRPQTGGVRDRRPAMV